MRMYHNVVSFLVSNLVVAAVGTTLSATHHGDKLVTGTLGVIAMLAMATAIVTLLLEQARYAAVLLLLGTTATVGFGWRHLPSVQRRIISWLPHEAWRIIVGELEALAILIVIAGLVLLIRDLFRTDGRLSRKWRSSSNPLHA